jgi:glycosyltransferase involved in cell wall biosynthesis
MHILVIAWEFPPRFIGGISRHVAELYPEIVKLGHNVHLITVEVEGAANYEIVDGISVHRVPVPANSNFFEWVENMNISMSKCATKLLETSKFDLINAHDWLVSDVAIEIAQKYHILMFATIHATEYGRYNGIFTDTHRYIHSKEVALTTEAKRVIVCTEYMREEVEHVLNCPSQKIDVIYNGLSQARAMHFHELNFDREALRAKFAAPDEAIVYYVGRITYEKGIFVLLNAAPLVIAAMSGKVKFVIIGSGDTQSLKQQAWDLGIHHKVEFTGFMSDDDLTNFQAVADCAVFPSLYEPFGIVALECFAAKVPVVVSDAGGLPEVVRDGLTGIVTHAHNGESLAKGILQILQNPEYRSKLVENALQDLRDRFDWQKLAKQTIASYVTGSEISSME